jgi:formylglycine-generating enzyme required for sulfatase activity
MRSRLLPTLLWLAGTGLLHASEEVAKTEQVLIPAGEFRMGAEDWPDSRPIHDLRVDAFYLDVHEVTNAQYFAFCRATGRRLPEFWGMAGFRSGLDFPDHPVIGVSWYDARDYAVWAGRRLPTEAEWEYAARGGLVGKPYPFGGELTAELARYSSAGPVAVGRFSANGYGLHDMAGNVWEWVADRYADDYYAASPMDNPPGPASGRLRVIRGGSWHSGPGCQRVDYRNALPPNWVDIAVGFRCACDTE